MGGRGASYGNKASGVRTQNVTIPKASTVTPMKLRSLKRKLQNNQNRKGEAKFAGVKHFAPRSTVRTQEESHTIRLSNWRRDIRRKTGQSYVSMPKGGDMKPRWAKHFPDENGRMRR